MEVSGLMIKGGLKIKGCKIEGLLYLFKLYKKMLIEFPCHDVTKRIGFPSATVATALLNISFVHGVQ